MNSARQISKTILLAFLFTALSGCATTPVPAYEDRDQPVAVQDLEILDRAGALLANESAWNRKDTRECPPDAKSLSLFCALQKASIEVIGTYDHRRAALQEVRFAIEDATGGREFEHRLMDFNNLAETRFSDIKAIIAAARIKVMARLEAEGRQPSPIPKPDQP